MDAWRVVQIAVGRTGKPDAFGSGYLVDADVVLTAAHVVENRSPEECAVRFPGSTEHDIAPVAGRTIWTAGSAICDLAVLRTERITSSAVVNRALFGRLARASTEAPAVTMGYPRWKLRRQERDGRRQVFRSLAQLRGRLKLATLGTGGGLELVIDDHPPGLDDTGPWGAMSGAPVWVGNRLVAIVSEHHPAEGAGRLTVQPIHDLYAVARDKRGIRAIRDVRLPPALDNLQPWPSGYVDAGGPRYDVTPIVRYVVESDQLPRKALFEGVECTVGRSRDNTFIVDRPGVGGQHCKLWVAKDETSSAYAAYVLDLGSTNGTYVNDKALAPYRARRLSEGDKVTLGVEATFSVRAVRRTW